MYLNNMILDGLTSFAVLTALTTGVVEAIKRVGAPKRYLPLLAIFVGILLTFLGGITEITSLSILTGIAVGLSSCGLFDQSKIAEK